MELVFKAMIHLKANEQFTWVTNALSWFHCYSFVRVFLKLVSIFLFLGFYNLLAERTQDERQIRRFIKPHIPRVHYLPKSKKVLLIMRLVTHTRLKLSITILAIYLFSVFSFHSENDSACRYGDYHMMIASMVPVTTIILTENEMRNKIKRDNTNNIICHSCSACVCRWVSSMGYSLINNPRQFTDSE